MNLRHGLHVVEYGGSGFVSFVVAVVVVVFCSSFNQTTCQVLPHLKLERSMRTFGKNLEALFRKTTAADDVKKDFVNSNATKVRKMDAFEVLNEAKVKLNNNFKRKKRALERLVGAAEKAFRQHTSTGIAQTNYPNAKNLSHKEFKLVIDEKFGGTPVNRDRSSVHVPTDVYDQAPSILNSISWSSQLDTTFKLNDEEDDDNEDGGGPDDDSSLSWQFFCSEEAHLRIYPGVQWRPPSDDAVLPSDVYDCRVQEWYIQASSSPKDVVVVLDVSGSMKGLNIEIAKTAVVKMLQTLTHDDFFNVLLYSDQVEFLEPCFQGTLVQATEINKERIKTNLDFIKPHNIANLESALGVAFELLLSGRKHGTSSNCNKMIMLMTDGGVQSCFEVFEKYNTTQNQIRIFTYLIGREVGESEFIKSLACLYSGSYYRISGFADVHEHIQKYLHQLSMGRSNKLAWSNTYYDVIEPGLGLVMTMAAPVYNSSSVKAALLGVAGTDLPVKEFVSILNSCKIGVNGYWFVIINSGFTVVHPNLLAQPDFLTMRTSYALDINRMEVMDKKGRLKRNMMRASDGNVVMETLTTLTREKVAILSKNVFHFSTLENSPFKIGLSLPVGYGEFHSSNLSDLFSNPGIYEDLWNLKNTNFTIAQWNYCTTDKNEDFINFIYDNKDKAHVIRSKCDVKLLQLLLNDVTTTKMIPDKWNKVLSRTHQQRLQQLEFVFLATRGGLSRYVPVNPTSDLLTQMKNQASTRDQLFYKLTSHHGSSILTFTVPSLENSSSTDPIIVASKPVTDSTEKSVLAVLGLALRVDIIEELLFRAVSPGCSDVEDDDEEDDGVGGRDDDGKCGDFCDNFCTYENVSCLLVDFYGYVIYSEKQEDIGSFLGDVDQMNGLMNLLKMDHHDDHEGSDHALFNRYTIVDLQSTCPISDEQSSSAIIQLSKPLEMILSSLKCLIGNLFVFSTEMLLLMESLLYLLFNHLIVHSSSQSCKNRPLSPTTSSSSSSPPLKFYDDDLTSSSYSSSSSSSSSSSAADESELSVLEEYLMRQDFDIEDPDLRSMMMECYGKYATQLDFQGKTTPLKNCFKEAKATWQKLNNRGNSTCFKRLMYYIANITRLPLQGSFSTCEDECEKFYAAQLVPGSDLIFLVTESTCECKEDRKASMKYSQIKYEDNATYFCQLLKQEPQRDRYSKCIAPTKEEFKKCSPAHRFQSSHAVLLNFLIVLPLFNF